MINKTFGCCRFIWNKFLEDIKNSYVCNKTFEKRTLKQLKEDYPWLLEVSGQSKCNVEKDFNNALSRFIKEKKMKKNKRIGFLKFKTKKVKQSYRYCMVSKKLLNNS